MRPGTVSAVNRSTQVVIVFGSASSLLAKGDGARGDTGDESAVEYTDPTRKSPKR